MRSEAAHFMEHVRLDLKASYGLDALYRGGLRIRTTLDMEWQRAAERAIRSYLPAPKDPEAALVAIDPRTGAIRAMVGGRSFERSEFNLATQGRRQAGSAFKPFVLLAALERGISPLELRNGPSSMTIPDPFCETNGKPWTVSNAGDQSAGTMSLGERDGRLREHDLRAGDGRGRTGGRRGRRAPDGDPFAAVARLLDRPRYLGGDARSR